ncbi:MAG: hypothetical protein ACJAT1_001960 [Marivirga sp.]|jgi:hypothetical protein
MKNFYYLIILSFFSAAIFSCENKGLVNDFRINNYLQEEFSTREFENKSAIFHLNAEGCESCVLQILAFFLNNEEMVLNAKMQLIIAGIPSEENIKILIDRLSVTYIADRENKLRNYYQGYFNGVIIDLENGEHINIVNYQDFEENINILF